jgi:WD40 repeat protein
MIRFKLKPVFSAPFILVAVFALGLAKPVIANDPWDHRTATFKKLLDGSVSYRVRTSYRQPHPQIPLLHVISHPLELEDFSQIGFHPDIEGVLYSTSWSGFLRKWDVESGVEKASFATPSATILEGFAFSNDNSKILSFGANGWLAVHDTNDLSSQKILQNEKSEVFYRTIAVKPNSSQFCLGRSDGIVEFWSLDEARKIGEIKIHDWPTQKLSYDQSGQFLFSADATGIALYDLNSLEPVRYLVSSEPVNGIRPFWFSSFSFSSLSDFVVVGTYRDTQVFNLRTSRMGLKFEGPEMGLINSWFIDRQAKIFAISRDLTIRIYSSEDEALLEERWLPLPLFAIASSIVTSPNMNYVAMTSQEPSLARMGSIPKIRLFRYLH